MLVGAADVNIAAVHYAEADNEIGHRAMGQIMNLQRQRVARGKEFRLFTGAIQEADAGDLDITGAPALFAQLLRRWVDQLFSLAGPALFLILGDDIQRLSLLADVAVIEPDDLLSLIHVSEPTRPY